METPSERDLAGSSGTSAREQIIEVATAAIEKHLHERLTQAVNEIELDIPLFQSFFTSVTRETDRALAVFAFAFIDDRIQYLFRRVLSPEITDGPDRLFEAFGPLATSHARIELAGALYWLSPITYRNLRLMRKIRNEFAHNPFLSTFDDQPIKGILASMEAVENGVLQWLVGRGRDVPPPSARTTFLAKYPGRTLKK